MKKTIFILILVLTACNKDDDGFTNYRVKAGNQYSCHFDKRILGKHSIQAWFKVNETWDMGYTGGWNKVLGIGLGANHKNNSCRLAYRCDDGVKKVGVWTYVDGVSNGFVIDTVSYGTYYVDIGHSYGDWHITFNGKTHITEAGKKVDVGYILFPHIGGDGTISHDWVVPIKFK